MKKLLSTVLVSCVLFAPLAGCGGSDQPEQAQVVPSPQPKPPAPQPPTPTPQPRPGPTDTGDPGPPN